jgi:hypothetical protein
LVLTAVGLAIWQVAEGDGVWRRLQVRAPTAACVDVMSRTDPDESAPPLDARRNQPWTD